LDTKGSKESFDQLIDLFFFSPAVLEKVGLDERDDFLAEIAMMKRVGRHDNIVVMLACVTLAQPYSMILEYVPYGDLLHYLRTLRTVYHQSKGY
jgi:serine/threonine protein kinase